ncbi:hypothetical protein CJ672_07550 [Arcobacter cryaerophilus gv. occultus]|nr:hypothetical protein CJ672_07550 [Arcobacter cryaerophilus gv. occultus]
MDNLYFGSGTLFHFQNWDARPTIVFSLTGLKSSFQLENNFSLKGWAFCSTFFFAFFFGSGTQDPPFCFSEMGL